MQTYELSQDIPNVGENLNSIVSYMTFVLTESFASEPIEGTETCGPTELEMLPTHGTVCL